MEQRDIELLDKFAASKEAKQFEIAYGGDGTLLRIASLVGNKKGIVPIRDYARCPMHESLLEEICTGSLKDISAIKHGLKYSKHNFLTAYVDGKKSEKTPISEIVVKNGDPTEAMRFSVIVNGKKYMSQCIADGFMFASALGAHGYFKSVARTLFTGTSNVGLAFLSPTYGICNLVLSSTDKLKIVLERSTSVSMAFDKDVEQMHLNEGSEIGLEQSNDGVALYGYDIFCCPECRKLRNSTLVNDQWLG